MRQRVRRAARCAVRSSSVPLALATLAVGATAVRWARAQDDSQTSSEAMSNVEEAETPAAFAVELSALPVVFGHYGASVEAAPAPHHAVIASAYYASVADAMAGAPSYRIHGVGSEIGYRFYSADFGPRGVFVGPSLLIGTFNAFPGDGAGIDFRHVGGAIDVGYQLLVDRVVLGFGVGAEYLWLSTRFRDFESLGATSIASPGLHPRALAVIGLAF